MDLLTAAPSWADVVQDETAWEALCDAGRQAAARLDEGRWLLGDLALRVRTRYGEDAVGKFATESGVEAKRVYEYRQVSAFYEPDARDFPNLAWTHFRDAMRLGEGALHFLERASAEGWTVEGARIEAARILGKPVQGKFAFRARIEGLDSGVLALAVEDADADKLAAWLKGKGELRVNLSGSGA